MFIRWLGAFRAQNSTGFLESVEWEMGGHREVAVEPLRRGKSKLLNEYRSFNGEEPHPPAWVGLVVDEEVSEFKRGFLLDCWSEVDQVSGRLYTKGRGRHRPFKDKDVFLRNLSLPTHGGKKYGFSLSRTPHAEAWFANCQYKAVAVGWDAPSSAYEKAEQVSKLYGLKVIRIKAWL